MSRRLHGPRCLEQHHKCGRISRTRRAHHERPSATPVTGAKAAPQGARRLSLHRDAPTGRPTSTARRSPTAHSHSVPPAGQARYAGAPSSAFPTRGYAAYFAGNTTSYAPTGCPLVVTEELAAIGERRRSDQPIRGHHHKEPPKDAKNTTAGTANRDTNIDKTKEPVMNPNELAKANPYLMDKATGQTIAYGVNRTTSWAQLASGH